MELIAKDGSQRSPIRQFVLPRTHHPGSRIQRTPRNFVDHAIGLGIIGGRVNDAAVDVADEAGNDRIKIDQKLLNGACGCGMRGVGNVGGCAPWLQFVVARDHRLQFAGVEAVEDRDAASSNSASVSVSGFPSIISAANLG